MIKDRFFLGAVSGAIGFTVKTLINEVFVQTKVSQKSFRSLAAGVWLPSRKQ